ncbi:hypothetical protein [Leptothrix discophora]|uniref:Uncharacterized protein n=1 Tax=Leptothrix discophora TaxID=89 RepID=A0ABT9G237_LEPDI|nr:hypothetical protein [Leptothrix discophora]MDP4300553.1 hypothetical protein [Leptothrix discophora]
MPRQKRLETEECLKASTWIKSRTVAHAGNEQTNAKGGVEVGNDDAQGDIVDAARGQQWGKAAKGHMERAPGDRWDDLAPDLPSKFDRLRT